MLSHKVVSNEVLNDKFNLITLKASDRLNFKIGQFVLVNVGKNINRAYSLASLPEELPFWKIFVDITPGGPGTTYLKNLNVGDIIQTHNPSGQFLLSKSAENYIFAATGCGIAPFLPMIEVLLNNNKRVYLIWGLRHIREITLKERFKLWSKNKGFSYQIVLSQPEGPWQGKVGHIPPLLLGKAKSLRKDSLKIYLSGSNDFIREASNLLQNNKINARKIHFEACF